MQNAPLTNDQIRDWYLEQISQINALNEQMIKENVSLHERAYRLWEFRHNLRLEARKKMRDEDEVDLLRARDMRKYGNPDGPSFEFLFQTAQNEGLTGNAIYEEIILTSARTDTETNKNYGSGRRSEEREDENEK